MSKLRANIGETMYSIKKWRGVNENPDGDTNLKDGEGAAMFNFRISDGGALCKRPGIKLVAGLATRYRVNEGEPYIFLREQRSSSASFTGYSAVELNSVGKIIGSGETKTLTYSNRNDIGSFYFEYQGRMLHFIGAEAVQNQLNVIEYRWTATWITSELESNNESSDVKALWSGFVGDTEYIVAACSGQLWQLTSESHTDWDKAAIGQIHTEGDVCLFGFDGKLYVLDGHGYYVWDGESFGEVEGYIPTIGVATSPAGETTLLERVNLLTPKRRQLFSADGSFSTYQLAEANIASVESVSVDGTALSKGYEVDLEKGIITFSSIPAKGSDNVEVIYSVADSYRDKVAKMRYAEFYNGVNDSRVFLYGDGSNVCIYSEPLYTTGRASAEYFPDLNEIGVGDSNTPLTSLLRHYDRMLAFKSGGGTYSIYYDSITLADGSLTAGFYCNSVNRTIGNDALGQAVLVDNNPRTIDGKSIYQWKSAGGGYMTNDQRNAERISDKVQQTLSAFVPEYTRMFYDKYTHEFYCTYGDKTLVQNTLNGAWYIYWITEPLCMINYKDELYFGSKFGKLYHMSNNYTSDDGTAILCHWESGSLSFGKDWMEKYSPELWVGLNQEPNASVIVGVLTDKDEHITETVAINGDSRMPTMIRKRLKGLKFTFYKLIFESYASDNTATVASVDIRAKYNIPVK